MSLVRIEARRNLGLWLFPVVMAAIWYLSYQERARGIWVWADVSLSIQTMVAVVGPVAAGIAAWTASKSRRRGIEELLATTSRPPTSRELASWVATTAWFVLAYTIVTSLIYLLGYLGGAWGSPVLWPVLVGLFAIVTHSALGYAVGYYLPSGFTAPMIATVSYLLHVTPVYFNSSVHHLSPLGESLTRSVFYGVLPNLFIGQTLWLLGLAGLALGAIALKQRRSATSLSMTLVAVAVATLGAVVLLEKNPWASPAQIEAAAVSHYDPVCVRQEIQVCVHPAYKEFLPQTTATVSGLVKPLERVPGVPTRAEQTNSSQRDPESNEVLSFVLHDKRSLGDQLAFQISGELVGKQVSGTVGGSNSAPGNAQAAIEAWLLRQAGKDSEYALLTGKDPEAIAAASQRFSELTPKKREEWLRKNYTDLRSWKLTLKDLP